MNDRTEWVLKYLKWMTGRGLVSSYEPDDGVLVGVIDWGPKDEDMLVYRVDVGRKALDQVWQLPEDEETLLCCLIELKARAGHPDAIQDMVDVMVEGEHREYGSFAKEWTDWAVYDWDIPIDRDGWPAEELDKDQLGADFKEHVRQRLREGKTTWLRPIQS